MKGNLTADITAAATFDPRDVLRQVLRNRGFQFNRRTWQVVGTYGFDTTCLGTPLHAVIGYRALSVDFSENGKFGKNGLDFVQHGPIMGVSFRW